MQNFNCINDTKRMDDDENVGQQNVIEELCAGMAIK